MKQAAKGNTFTPAIGMKNTDWTCEQCGTRNPSNYYACPNCNRPRGEAGGTSSSSPSVGQEPTSGLEAGGWLLFALGLFGLLISVFLKTTVTTAPVDIPGVTTTGGGEVHNLGLITQKLTTLLASGFVSICGLLLLVAGKVVSLSIVIENRA